MTGPRLLVAERWLIGVAVAGSALVMWPSRSAAFGLPKATFVVVLAIGGLGLAATRTLLGGGFEAPRSGVLAAGAVVIAVMTTMTVVSPTPGVALMGSTRQTGLVSYLAYAVLAFLAFEAFRGHRPHELVVPLLVATVVVSLYGLAQVFGWQPLPFGVGTAPVISTLGNSNFLSGWLGLVAPLVLWLGLAADGALPWVVPLRRTGAAVLGSALLVVLVSSRSFQGVPAAMAGCALVAGVWARQASPWGTLTSHPRRRAVVIAAAIGLVALAALVSARLLQETRSGLEPRADYWAAAVRLAADHPATGTGPETFARYYPAYYENVSGGPYEQTDDPHSVPLAMLTSGGIPLLVAYLTLVVVTGVALIRRLRSAAGQDRLFLAALGGAWIAYQVQSLVSIDIPPLAVAHWVLGAAIAVSAGVAEPAVVRGRRVRRANRDRARGRRRRGPTVPLGSRIALSIVAAFGLVAAALALRPMRAVAAADRAQDALNAHTSEVALSSSETATHLAPWDARNWYLRGAALERVGRFREAREAARRAFHLNPGTATYAIIAAELADRDHDVSEAVRYYRKALAADPVSNDVVAGGVRGLLLHGKTADAWPTLARALRRGGTAELWSLAGRIHDLEGRRELAVVAYRHALDLDPTNSAAKTYLARSANG